MKRFTRFWLVAIPVGLAIVSSASHVAAQRRETTTITRLYTGADGQSHAEDTDVAWRPAKLRAELSDSEAVRVTAAQDHTTRVGADEDLVMLLLPLAQ
jgi:hypothetical protein